MNDEQLARELERRADSAASRPDWVRRDLLPAVRHEIDTRPQRVVTSNWSPRLGVAAVVAALLVLVIAVPRLTPQPPAATASPSASPAPGPDTVLSTTEFAAGVASGQLIGRIVLVEGRISVPAIPEPVDYPCNPPVGLCGLGALDGTDPPIYVDEEYLATTDSPGSGTWAGGDGGRDYHFPSVPIEGVLALRPLSGNHAVFIGLVKQNAGRSVMSVAEARSVDISTVTSDDVVLVRGWLIEPDAGSMYDCANPYPDLPGLPSRWCTTHSYLSSKPDRRTDRFDLSPPEGADYVRVQPGAANAFAVVDSEALYAISPRLYGGGCAGAPPCWQWSVVGRVNGPPLQPVTTGPTTVECKRSIGPLTTVSDTTGVVSDCRVLEDVSPSDQPMVFNPDENLSRLQVWFMVSRCINGADAQFSVRPGGYDLVITEGAPVPNCVGPRIGIGLDLNLRLDIGAAIVSATYSPQPTPSPTPPPTPPVGTRTFACEGSEALGDPGITLIDHSGRIGGCSIAQAEFTPDGAIDVSTTRLPLQLAATWTVNAGCPADEQLEFWGPIEQPLGHAEFVLQLARQHSARRGPATCRDVLDVRQVEIAFTVVVRPADILAISVDRSTTDGSVSSDVSGGAFDLLLAAPQALSPNEPIDVTSLLTYTGTDPVTLSGHWQPDFVFTSLTGGPNFFPYGSLLLCPEAEVHLSGDENVAGHLQGPLTPDPTDPNYAYRTQYAYDGQLRLPAGAYLIQTGVVFAIGSNCSGEYISLHNAIVIEVGLIGSSGILDSTASP